MSLVIPGLGKTIMPKRRRPSPKTKIMPRGTVPANPYVTDKKPRPKLGSKPSGGKVTANPYVTDNKPRPKLGSKPRGRKVTANPYVTDKKPRPKLGSKPSGKKYEGPMRPGMRPSRPSPIKASGKRGGARPISSPARRPRGRR